MQEVAVASFDDVAPVPTMGPRAALSTALFAEIRQRETPAGTLILNLKFN